MIQPLVPFDIPGNALTISGNATLETVTFIVAKTNAKEPVANAR